MSTISSKAKISPSAKLGESVQIGNGTSIGNNVEIGVGTVTGKKCQIMSRAVIGDFVRIGRNVEIGNDVLILHKAIICPDQVHSGSSDARRILIGASIGPGVMLHNEAEIGAHAVIPTQRAIASIGNFGSKNRVVTIYGSDEGPRYSIGCQIGEDFGTIFHRVDHHSNTTEKSADTYKPFLEVFQQIGSVVQNAYEIEAGLVGEIRAIRQSFGMY